MAVMPSEGANQRGSRLNSFLDGIRVVDLSSNVPGPTTTLALADMGARVLKIEAPSGDPLRRAGPIDADGRSVFFHAINSGKAIISLDLKDASDRGAFLKIVEKADVLVEGFRPDVLTRLGLAQEALLRANPRLIICSVNGYGADGPLSDKAGLDSNFLALSGILHANDSHRPIHPPLADCATSTYALSAILGALIARSRDGQGCHIECALADAPMAYQQIALSELGAIRSGIPQRPDTMGGDAAYYRFYDVKDGRRIVLTAREQKFWAAFCDAAGRPEWIARRGEAFPQIALADDLQSFFSTKSVPDIEEMFGSTDSCISIVVDLTEALSSPHHASRGLVRRVDNTIQASFPAVVNGKVPKDRSDIVVDRLHTGSKNAENWESWW
jgi:crotonobetainyl-CoA:carnitine CoA-transferase CaiB-like acyl-CoA transferase